MRITVKMLEKMGACLGRVNEFAEVFPNGAKVTPENVEKALCAGLDIRFLNYVFGRGHGYGKTAYAIDACIEPFDGHPAPAITEALLLLDIAAAVDEA
jgi:hypothetical protein